MIVDAVVLRAADSVVMPWRNGGGITREYIAHPSTDDFEWRLSVADVSSSGPFSTFTGFDRILVLLACNGMTLAFAGGRQVALTRALDLHRFAGDDPVRADLVDGPTTDLNLIWRRDLWSAEVRLERTPISTTGPARTLAFVVEGDLSAGTTVLGPGDLLVTGAPVRLGGGATVVVFELRPVAATPMG